MKLPFTVGVMADGERIHADLADLPHLLVAGTTGSGKSVFINSLIIDLIESSNARFLMIDPKRVEMAAYRDSPRLIRQPIFDMGAAVHAIEWIAWHMEQRFQLLMAEGLKSWDQIPGGAYRVVVVIDELANLMLTHKEVEQPLVAIASQGRAAGIHLVAATQRPSADVLTGLLRANIPARAAFATVTSIDSRIILDQEGAEKLKGHGDMLYRNGTSVWHVQAPMVSDETIRNVARNAR